MDPVQTQNLAGPSQSPNMAPTRRRRKFFNYLCCGAPVASSRIPSGSPPYIGRQDELGHLQPMEPSVELQHPSQGQGAAIPMQRGEPSALFRMPSVARSFIESDDRFSIQLNKVKHLVQGQFDHFKAEIEHGSAKEIEKKQKFTQLWVLKQRFDTQLEHLATHLHVLYGDRYELMDILKSTTQKLITIGLNRPEELRSLDLKREKDPNWFSSNKSVEATIYVENHCGRLSELEKEIDLFKLLKISILHLMPTIFKTPAGDNDGGYAVSDFRSLNPEIGTMEELSNLFAKFRENEISPALDVTINHTSSEHQWAQEAMAGNTEKQDYYFLMDKAEKDQYQPYLQDIFPTIRKGSFTWNNEVKKFVWTTFKSCQWDLNYANPKVLMAMAEEMLFLANKGAEVLRLDSVPCLWKKKGTNCLNQNEISSILHVFNAIMKIAAPAILLKSEAIESPKTVKRYVGPDTCQIAYNPMIMLLTWDALCNQNARLMTRTLSKHIDIPEGSAWVNYLRCHDDILYNFDPETARELGIDLDERERKMTDFYLGKTDGSYARGLPFQADAQTGRARITGTLGSLAGVEKALEQKDPQQIEWAVQRIRLINSVILSMPGIPLLNLIGGDDRGQINDYSYLQEDIKKDDSRWVNRLKRDIDFEQMDEAGISAMDRLFTDLVDLTRVRVEEMPAFGIGRMHLIEIGNDPVLGFIRQNEQQIAMVLANFSDKPQSIDKHYLLGHAMPDAAIDMIGPEDDQYFRLSNGIELAPYQCMWLVSEDLESSSTGSSNSRIHQE